MDNLLVLENKNGFKAKLNSDIVKEIYLSLKNRYNENKYSNDTMCAIACLGFTLLKDFDCILEEAATKKQDIKRTKETIKKLDYFFDNINKTDKTDKTNKTFEDLKKLNYFFDSINKKYKVFEDLKKLDGLIEFYNNHNCEIYVFPINVREGMFLEYIMKIKLDINSRKEFKELGIKQEKIDINKNKFYITRICINCLYNGDIKLKSIDTYSQNDIDYLLKRGVDIFYEK